MKRNLLLITILLFVFVSMEAQPKVRYLNVDRDQNVRQFTDPKLCASCSDLNFIVDGNESHGYIELEFSGINSCGKANNIDLIMNVSNAEWAESPGELIVYCNNQKIGSIIKVNRNSSFTVRLNAALIADKNSIKLTLKTKADDGMILLSKKSGFGAVLKLTY